TRAKPLLQSSISWSNHIRVHLLIGPEPVFVSHKQRQGKEDCKDHLNQRRYRHNYHQNGSGDGYAHAQVFENDVGVGPEGDSHISSVQQVDGAGWVAASAASSSVPRI